MNSMGAIALTVIAAFLAAVSQLMLKKSANKKYNSLLSEYLNFFVLSSYALLFFTTFLNMISMQHLPFKMVPVLNTLSYLFVFIFSGVMLKERIGKKQKLGALLIFAGIVIFNM